MNTVFEHISVFEESMPENQLRAIVRFVLETRYFSEQDEQKLSWRIQKYAAKINVPYHKAAEKVRDAVREEIEKRLEKVL